MGFTPQCVVLEYCGCAHHWCEKDVPTEINYSVFRDKYFLHQLTDNTIACWEGVGVSKAGKWKKGLYQYSVHISMGTEYEGTFTVY